MLLGGRAGDVCGLGMLRDRPPTHTAKGIAENSKARWEPVTNNTIDRSLCTQHAQKNKLIIGS